MFHRRFERDTRTRRRAAYDFGQALTNGFDRLFRTDALVKADRTPYEVIHQKGLLKLRYYPPLQDRHIQVGDDTLRVAETRHRTPIVLVPPLAASTPRVNGFV